MRLFLPFLLIPLIEIALFILIGGAIGLGWTLAIVIGTALLGTVLVRSQGSAVLGQLKASLEDLRDPTEPLAHGAMILFSGALLLTPGFFTDALGFLLLVPGVRDQVLRFVKARVTVAQVQYGRTAPRPASDPTIIDGEYRDLGTRDPGGRPSGWTRH